MATPISAFAAASNNFRRRLVGRVAYSGLCRRSSLVSGGGEASYGGLWPGQGRYLLVWDYLRLFMNSLVQVWERNGEDKPGGGLCPAVDVKKAEIVR